MKEQIKTQLREEFTKEYLSLFRDQRLEDPTIRYEGNTGIDALIINDQINNRAKYKVDKVANFWLSKIDSLLQSQRDSLVEKGGWLENDFPEGLYTRTWLAGYYTAIKDYQNLIKQNN